LWEGYALPHSGPNAFLLVVRTKLFRPLAFCVGLTFRADGAGSGALIGHDG
jgi:hypothetical protein